MAVRNTLVAPPCSTGEATRDRAQDRDPAERDLRRARRIMRALDAGGIGVWEVDVLRDRIAWDRRTFDIFGIEPRDFDGTVHGWLRFVEPDDLIATRLAVADAMAGRRPLDQHFRIRRPDRSIRHLRISGETDRDDSGRATRMYGIVLDVTQAVVASVSDASAESVERSRRLHNEMLLRMGHDLRSPLNAMMGFAQLIERHPSEMADAVRQHARHIADAGSRLLGLLADLLDLSRIGVAPPAAPGEGFNAAEALRHCADAFVEPGRRCDVRVETEVEPSLPVRGSAEALVQAVHRLLHHCLARSPRGSRILVRAQRVETPSGAGVRIEISDGGPPLGEAERLQLFTPFSASSRLGAGKAGQDDGLTPSWNAWGARSSRRTRCARACSCASTCSPTRRRRERVTRAPSRRGHPACPATPPRWGARACSTSRTTA
jgi:two-component system sensor histidine kinase/response regulator